MVSLEIAEYLHEQSIMAKRANEQLLLAALGDLLSETTEWSQKFLKLAKTIQAHLPFDYLAIATGNTGVLPDDNISFLRTGFNDYQMIGTEELMNISGQKKAELRKLQEASAEETASTLYQEKEFMERCKTDPLKRLISRAFENEVQPHCDRTNCRQIPDCTVIFTAGKTTSITTAISPCRVKYSVQ